MNHMSSLMAHYLENPHMKPSEALENWNTTMANSQAAVQGPQNPNQGQPQQPQQQQQQMQPNMQPGVRPPGPPGMFMSPALQNSLLPNGGSMNGSPHMMHTPSPHSQAMMKQQSTSSHTASVNTSPNMNNKRRRSTAKMEQDDGSGDMNGGPKVKQSPRGGVNKRMKAGN